MFLRQVLLRLVRGRPPHVSGDVPYDRAHGFFKDQFDKTGLKDAAADARDFYDDELYLTHPALAAGRKPRRQRPQRRECGLHRLYPPAGGALPPAGCTLRRYLSVFRLVHIFLLFAAGRLWCPALRSVCGRDGSAVSTMRKTRWVKR